MRTEKDLLGTRQIPHNAYFGIHTKRAVENFPISGLLAHPILIRAYGFIKQAAALSNASLGLLDKNKAEAIINASKEVALGKFNNQFVVDVFQAGAGTSFHMNVNEVIANRALELLGHKKGDYRKLHPNDDVNMAQSTNDTFPTAMRIAILLKLKDFAPALSKLSRTFHKKGMDFNTIIKTARTHLQDAVPIRLGQEFDAYGRTLEKCLNDILRSAEDLQEIGIGGTAAGTGINAHPRYARLVVQKLRVLTKLQKLKLSSNLIEIMQSQQAISHFSSTLKNCAVEINRIANDLRLLASGPNTGLKEITLPSVQAGSSIMPGKINPSILECATMVCMHVQGADYAVSLAVSAGQLNLNVCMPLMAYELLFSLDIFQNAITIMDEKCVRGITADKKRCNDYAMSSPSVITALSPIIGYEKSAEIAKEFTKTGKSINDIILDKKILTQKKVNELMCVKKLT